jgi:predicted anti-sigma-YlaC factor YlaD
MQPTSQLCERARAWASLRADGELSELEGALLAAHLDRCPSCREVASGFVAVSEALRAAAVERPAPIDVSVRRPRRVGHVARIALVAVLLVGAGLVSALQIPRHTPAPVRHVAMIAAVDPAQELRQLRRPELVARPRAIPRNRQLPDQTV